MYYAEDRTYADWQDYIAGGRKKYERTLYDRGYRIQYANKFNKSSDIQIVMPWINNHPLITIHPDNTRTIYSPSSVTTHWGGTWSPLRAYSVRFTIYKYTGVEVVQRNFKFQLYERDAKISPPKIQGCRNCGQTGRVDSWCNASYCWDVDEKTSQCPTHPEAKLLPVDIQRGRHVMACEHGDTIGHNVTRGQECYHCNGTRKRDYGSKRVSLAWDGSPIKVENGNIVRKPLTDLERIVAAYAGPTSKV
jgi:hypothetical protein